MTYMAALTVCVFSELISFAARSVPVRKLPRLGTSSKLKDIDFAWDKFVSEKSSSNPVNSFSMIKSISFLNVHTNPNEVAYQNKRF
jgi:hypothetical protein